MCRQLGLSGGKVMDFHKGNRSVAMTGVRCAGNEANIMLCDSEYVTATATSHQSVGIQCSSEEGGLSCIQAT